MEFDYQAKPNRDEELDECAGWLSLILKNNIPRYHFSSCFKSNKTDHYTYSLTIVLKKNEEDIFAGKNINGTSKDIYVNMNPGAALRLAVHMTRQSIKS